MTLNKFTAEVHENAVAHGWWDEERSLAEIVALCHSELSEALEEYRAARPMLWFAEGSDKPEGIAVELADCIIRILDWFGKCGVNTDGALEVASRCNFAPIIKGSGSFGEFITERHMDLSKAYEQSAPDMPCGWSTIRLAHCIQAIIEWAKANGVDMEKILDLKHAYNKGRPYRHGGKIL